jgi:hypothetical protein
VSGQPCTITIESPPSPSMKTSTPSILCGLFIALIISPQFLETE